MSIFKKLQEKKGISLTDPKIKKQLDDIADKVGERKSLVVISRDGKLFIENGEHLTPETIEAMKKKAAEDYHRQQAAVKKYQKEKDRLAKLGKEKVEGGRKINFIETATQELESLRSEMAEAVEWLKKHGYKKYEKDTIINHQPIKAGQWFKNYQPVLTDEESKAQLAVYRTQQKNIEEQGRARNVRILGEIDAQSIPKF